MILGIDASNIRAGGGITHLVELLRAADPPEYGFSRVMVWSGRDTLERIEARPWLVRSEQPLLNRSLACRIFWQHSRRSRLARAAGCDLLFVTGGSYAGDFSPVVNMSQNLLPFEWSELRRYGWTWMALRNLILRTTQTRAFRRAEGLIFLTSYAREIVIKRVKSTSAQVAVIPHGIDRRFFRRPGLQLPISRYTPEKPFRILYVSIVEVYKHQWRVAEAVARLRESGWPVALDLIGPAYPPALKRVKKTVRQIDPRGEFIFYSGAVPYQELPGRYARSDLAVFASSCENMPNILLEGMAAGLPIACSNRGPMPEILGGGGVYFDPEDPDRIAAALRELIASPELRAEKAGVSSARAREYSWNRCAGETFSFLARIAAGRRPENGSGRRNGPN